MEIRKLHKWFTSKTYDLEDKELNKILKLGNITNNNVLVVGTYGVLCISFKLLRHAQSVTAIHNSAKIVNYCKKKNNKIDFQVRTITETEFAKKQFDVIISLWDGLHYRKNKAKIIMELKRILKDKGILLIEEADETSEFVKILNIISPNKKTEIRRKRAELKKILKEIFDVKEKRLITYYRFQNKNQCKRYIEKEIFFDEKKKFTREMADKIEKYLSSKRKLKIQEKSMFFICKKKRGS